ncbi:hypothetical protein U0355_12585 [Salimicrobium sp. PL1-032A]|uniref:hypothetical protein n=1 Tax=Salimicrobium sp. PL1-032A TaxID=3095364 RepID=UPI0032609780
MRAMLELINSPVSGKVTEVLVKEKETIHEWEPLVKIATEDGAVEKIAYGISGNIVSVDVAEGDTVSAGATILSLRDDFIITGSD